MSVSFQVPVQMRVPRDMTASTYVLIVGIHTSANVELDMC